MKVLEDGNFTGKRVIVRIDADVPLTTSIPPQVRDDYRLRVLLPTLNFLLNRQAKVVLCAHVGRPEGKANQSLSLRPIYIHLSALLRRPISFAPNLFSADTKKAVENLEEGKILGLENLRFDKGEEANSRTFARRIADYGEIFINESFATAHRNSASTTSITEFLPSFGGLHLEQEYSILTNLLRHPARPFVTVIGGAKAQDKLPVIAGLLPKVDRVLVGGRVANNFLAATSFDIKKSYIEPKLKDEAKLLLKRARGKIIIPKDGSWRNDEILDLGKDTITEYKRYIKQARTIFWSGPLGVVEEPPFDRASEEIATAAVESGATTIAGGGDTAQMLHQFGLRSKFSFVSTGGSASLVLLAGQPLPAIRVLD